MPPHKPALGVEPGILMLFWKGFAMGVAFPLSDESEEFMTDVQPSPLAAVPKKQNPCYSPNWLHTILYAVRHYHLLVDVNLNLIIMLRLALAKKGWKRIYGSDKRKIAATVELLEEVYYNCSLTTDARGDLVLITAISAAFRFLLRSSEYLRKNASPDPEKMLESTAHRACIGWFRRQWAMDND